MSGITIASVCPLFGDRHDSIDYIIALVDSAALLRPDLLVLPELRFGDGSVLLPPLCERAATHRVHLVAALRERIDDTQYESSAVLVDRSGEVIGRYQQTHCLPEESLVLGDVLPVFPTEIGPVGMTIGTDHLFFEPYGVLACKGAQVVTWSGYPEAVRQYTDHDVKWRTRAMDYDITVVTSTYADELPFFPPGLESKVPGSPSGRSQIINRGGASVGDTGYEEGVAVAVVDPDRRKRATVDERSKTGLPPYARSGAPIWYLNYFGRREELGPLAELPAGPPPRSSVGKTVRVAVQSVRSRDIWKDGSRPQAVMDGIESAAKRKTDLIVCSEHAASLRDSEVRRTMDDIGRAAATAGTYIVVGGIRDDSGTSTAYLWDRTGTVAATVPISWTGQGASIRAIQCDFGKIGIRVCGDLERPEIDRVFALQGAEIVVDPSQMWAPGGFNLELITRARCMDNGLYVVCSHFARTDHSLRSFIMDPYGAVIAATHYGGNDIVVADIELGRERPRYVGDPDNSRYVQTDSYMDCYTCRREPEVRYDFWRTMFLQRRPELYGVLCEEEKKEEGSAH